jgi:PAS domain S-box-containing protein
MKILIVDDNANDRKLSRLILERHGYRTIIEARDGREGLEMARAHRPDLIISDALMPQLDGFQFLWMLKTDENLKTIPFVFYSAVYTGLKDEEFASRLGAEGFIVRPKEPEDFWREMSAIMENLAAGRRKPHPPGMMEEEKEYLRKYSEVVAAKLEEKVRELEESLARRKEAEERLKLASAYNRSLIEASLDPLVTINDIGKITDVNAATEKVTGYPREHLVGTDFSDYFTDPEKARTVYRQVFREGTVHDYELKIRHRDGHVTPVLYNAAVYRDENGNALGVFAAARDITERKRMEDKLHRAHDELEKRVVERTEQLEKTAEALSASEERYALAVQGANDVIWDMNLLTGEAYHSSRYKSMLGYEENQMANNFNAEEWWERIHPDDHQRVIETRDAYLEGRIPAYKVECRIRHKDGGYLWVVSRGACLRDPQDRPYRMAGSLTDITEHKNLEQQLMQAQKMESIGMLAGGVAHEFNNLLTAISGYAQILQDIIPADNALPQDSIGHILKAAERAAELTRSLLAFSRKQVINPKPIYIENLISNTGKLIQRIIGEDIEFSTGFSGKNLRIKADPGHIEQVLMNLATNARDVMPQGGRLSIRTEPVVIKEGSEAQYDLPTPGKYALISVADTGTGIDKKSLGSIFEPFYTTKEIGKGTGLGLSIVYGIIKQHNGSILVSSKPGEGTTFNIYLPLLEGNDIKEESKISALHAGGMETLLVVEDEEIVRVFMKKILERAGYKVIVSDNGEEAVARFKENDDISLVLSDVVMPRKNGKEMLDEMKKMKPGIKVVFISGYTADIISQKGMIEEGAEFITKPFNKGDLLMKVREILDRD